MRRSDHLGCDWQPNGTEAGFPGPSRYFRKDTCIRWSTEGKTSKSTRLDNNGKLEILREVRRAPKIPVSFRYGVRIRAPWLTLQLHYDMSNQRILRIPKQECTKIMEDVRGVYSAYEEKVPYVFMMTERLRRVFILDVFCSLLHIKSLMGDWTFLHNKLTFVRVEYQFRNPLVPSLIQFIEPSFFEARIRECCPRLYCEWCVAPDHWCINGM